MGKKLFGFHGLEIREPTLRVGIDRDTTIAPEPPKAPEQPAMLYAVSVPRRGGLPQVFCYDNNQDGHRELANLVRGEDVLAVIVGHRIKIESTSVIELSLKGNQVTDRIVLDP